MTVNLLPIPVARDELDLRLRSIGMPPEAIVVVEMLGPLDDMDRRLAGVFWKVIGREVPITKDVPDYPFLLLQVPSGGNTVRQVQIWEWHICPVNTTAFAMYRWRPERAEELHFVSLSQNPTQRMQECARLTNLFELTKYHSRLGRPWGSGAVRSNQELLELIIPIIEESWRQGIRPTQKRVVRLLPRKIDGRRLRKLCTWMGERWDPFIERLRQEMLARPSIHVN